MLIPAEIEIDDDEEPLENVELGDPNLEASFIEEEDDFDDRNCEIKATFRTVIECFAHSLQLPLRKVFERDEHMISVKKAVMAVVRKFAHSSVATQARGAILPLFKGFAFVLGLLPLRCLYFVFAFKMPLFSGFDHASALVQKCTLISFRNVQFPVRNDRRHLSVVY
jgi:hypothetical protein